MQRRSALKGLTMLGGLVSLPAWASGWTADSVGAVSALIVDDEVLLGDIVETFIPETTTLGESTPGASTPGAKSPGAKSLNVHQFVMRVIRDCYGEPAQTTLQQGLALAEATAQQTAGKAFAACDAPQRLAVLTALTASADPAGKAFVDLVKRLTIQGYTNSEYYLVNVAKFTMAPGFYHGCVPVPKVALTGSR
ncbi:MAG: gluconate 2-dehydrogenase subunit 3 family protein [Bacteroidetes bacterium]|nr:gluconate 2-dehydrogenase subunit 3 family protein [Fibrella sp.]